MARGSLFKVMRASAEGPLPLRLVRTVAVQVARGMASLHSRPQPLLHLDLKSPNILLDDKWRVKIADFGLARLKVHAHVTPGAPSGTPEWMAPEVLRSEPYAEGADVYSYGVVLWEMLTGQQPWEGLLPVQVVGAVGFQGKTLPPPATGDPFLARVCESCLSQLPGARPSFDAILQVGGWGLGVGGWSVGWRVEWGTALRSSRPGEAESDPPPFPLLSSLPARSHPPPTGAGAGVCALRLLQAEPLAERRRHAPAGAGRGPRLRHAHRVHHAARQLRGGCAPHHQQHAPLLFAPVQRRRGRARVQGGRLPPQLL